MSGIGGSQEYRLSIIVEGQDKASAPLGGVGGALGNIAQIAGGILTAGFFVKIAGQILDMGKSAIQATADYQSMQVGLEALLAREISRGQTQEKLVAQSISLTAAQKLKMLELTSAISSQTDQLSLLQVKYDEVSNSQGTGSEAALKLQIQIEKMTSSIGSANNQLAVLKDQSDGTTMVLQNIATGAMSIAEAMPKAQQRAKELLGQIRMLAIQSPFELTTIQNTFKMGMAFGFTADESLAFTRGLMNVAAGVGASSEMLDRMAYNLAQVRMQGKITAIDVRQLAMAGFDLNGALRDIGKQFGYTIEDYQGFNKLIEEGKISWADFATSFESYADNQFGGASKRLSQTWSGMMSNVKDVWNLSMPAVLGPAMENVTGFLNGIMQRFVDFTNSGKLEEWGAKIGDAVQGVIDIFDKLPEVKADLDTFFSLISGYADSKTAFRVAFNVDIPPDLQAVLDGALSTVHGFIADVRTAFGDPIKIKNLEELQGRIGIFGYILNGDIHNLTTALSTAFGIELPPDLLKIVDSVIGFIDKIKLAIDEAKPVMDSAFDKFGEFWSKNGAGIVQGMQDIQKAIKDIGIDSIGQVFNISGGIGTEAISFFADTFKDFAGWISENGPTIHEFLVKTGDFLRFLGEVFKVVFTVIGGVLQLAWAIIEPLLKGLFTIIGDSIAWLMRTFSNIVEMFEKLFAGDFKGAFELLGTIVKDTFATMWSIVTTLFNSIIEAIIGAFNTIAGWFGLKLESLHTTWKEKWTLIKDSVIDIWNKVKTGITTKFLEIKEGITEFIKDAILKVKEKFAEWKQAGIDMVQGFWNGIKEEIQKVKDWLSRTWEEIVATAKRILGIHSPSSVFAGIGDNLMKGLANGITGGLTVPVNATVDAAQAVTQAMPSSISNHSQSTNSYKIEINVNGSNDPERVAAEIMGLLRLQGVSV